MNYLNIDIGRYSVKIMESTLERKWVVPKRLMEFVLDDYRPNFPSDLSDEELSFKIISDFVAKEQSDFKIIETISSELVTSRYLSLPVNNKRRAMQMIPFQLEEGLPYPITEGHYDALLEKNGKEIAATVNIIKKPRFHDYFSALTKRGMIPHLLTSEHSLFINFVSQKREESPYAILDIGHQTTKAYFVVGKKIVATHLTYVAGKLIDDFLEMTYRLKREEAVLYKHNNAFFLTSSQYAEATPDQVEFAKLMKHVFTPLITDIKRWDLGLRIKYGVSCDHFYLTGGTSAIRNIGPFLSEEIDKPVQHLELYGGNKSNEIFSNDQKNRFGICELMALSQMNKNEIINFLSGEFAQGGTERLPIHSLVFATSRVFLLSAVLFLFLIVEHAILLKEESTLDTRLTKVLKSPQFELSKKELGNLKRSPETLLKTLRKKTNSIDQEVNTIMAASRVNATLPLVKMSQILTSNEKVTLTRLDIVDGVASATFTSDFAEELTLTAEQLRNSNLANLTVTQGPTSLEVTFKEDL